MLLKDLINREPVPMPWVEADNIPWNEPGFSERMLKEHLSQDHDAASRRYEKIDRHVAWIHDHILNSQPARVLDLGCGPGLYAGRLAQKGHDCVGIDFSPASIAYATDQRQPGCAYRLEDIRKADYGSDYDLVMLIFGELNVFKPDDARLILQKANQALKNGGILLLEPHIFSAIQRVGEKGTSWYTSANGLFSSQSHLVLTETFWDSATQTATLRYYLLEAQIGSVTQYGQSFQAYTDEEYRQLLFACDFQNIKFYPSLMGEIIDPTQTDFFALTAHKSS